MQTFFLTALLIASIMLIISVMMQPSKSEGLSGSIGGGAEHLFTKKRKQGYETIFHRTTIVVSILILALSVSAVFWLK